MADSPAEVAERLHTAELTPLARFASASNVTLLCWLGAPEDLPATDGPGPVPIDGLAPGRLAVVKPRDGEAPLWDFPTGTLYLREVAAHEVDRRLGWDLVPATVRRQDTPFGPAAVQRFVPHDPDDHWFTLVERDDPALERQLLRVVLFDLLVDNADRKASHVLVEGDRVRLIDHGVTFNVAPKLRTVAWEYAHRSVPADDRADVARLASELERAPGPLTELLSEAELDVLVHRARRLAELPVFPPPSGPRPYPWPPI